MISWHDLYTVLSAMVPLYVAMILAYGSVRWWKIFSPDQCSGINRFVAVFAVPLLSFHFISTNNPYEMNFRFIAADTLQKLIMLAALTAWSYMPCLHLTGSSPSGGSLEWVITLFSLSTLPNTLVMGIPLLIAMYGDYSGSLMVQVVVLQCIIWYTLLLFLFEYRGARILIMEQFPETAASIVSFKVDSDVVSLDGRDFLETDAEIGDDGKLHVTLRKSNASRRSFVGGGGGGGITPRPSNLTGAEIYSLSSSRNPTPRGSNFNNSDFYSMIGYAGPFLGRHSNFGAADLYSVQSSRGPTPRPSNFEEPPAPPPPPSLPSANVDVSSPRFGYYPASATNPYPTPNPEFIGDIHGTTKNGTGTGTGGSSKRNSSNNNLSRELLSSAGGMERKLSHDAKELHMFVWSSSASPVSEVGGLQVFGGSNCGTTTTTTDQYHHSGRSADGAKEIRMLVSDHSTTQNGGAGAGAGTDHQDHGSGPFTTTTKLGGSDDMPLSTMHPDATYGGGELEKGGGGPTGDHDAPKHMPPARVMTRLILIMVWRKLIRNPNTYSSLIGLIWSLVSFRWHVRMPIIIEKSISILSDAGLGMAMFSLGLFMALQPKMIACGNSVATFSMFIRFVTGPAVMAIASIAIGLKGDLLRVAIVQAALPQGIVPFVFAKEYNNHPAILSTGVIFGMLIALPIDLLYYVLLGL